MPIIKKEFHRSEKGMGDEDWYYLARDTETGGVFVLHEWSYKKRDGYEPGSAHVELDVFLGRRGTASGKLRTLIGTLVG